MILTPLTQYWEVCQKLRHGTVQERSQASKLFQAAKMSKVHKLLDKALKNVDIVEKKHTQ